MSALVELVDVHVVHRARSGSILSPALVYALTGARLQIAAGETIGVVGESGCGKTTLADVLVGLVRPTTGSVLVRGEDMWRMSSAWRRNQVGRHVGIVFQDPGTSLNRRLTVRRILRDPLDVHRWHTPQRREARVAELLGLVGLPSSVADVLPGQLSGGQRQRVAIARALALEPEVLIADEPTSALDVSVRAQVLNLLLNLRTQLGLAMVYISHDIQTVRRVADRVVTMYLGHIVEETPVGQIDAGARHPYTRALLSATPSLLYPTETIELTGPVPSAVHPPSGCPFRTRCWRAEPRCADALPDFTIMPAAGPAETQHRFRCYNPLPDPTDPSDPADPTEFIEAAGPQEYS